MSRMVVRSALCAGTLLISALAAFAQDPTPVASALQTTVQTPEVTYFQLQSYLMKRIAIPHAPARPEEWNASGQKLRKHILEDIIYHGWPQSWVQAPPHFEQVAVMDARE